MTNARDVFFKVTDKQSGAVIVTAHRAWDSSRLAAAMQQQYRDADAKEKTPGRHVVEIIDEGTYKALREPARH